MNIKINTAKSSIIGAIAICFAAILWGLDGVVLTPRLVALDILLVVFVLHALPFIVMSAIMPNKYKLLNSFNTSDYIGFLLIATFGGVLGTYSIVKALFLVNFQSLTVVVLLQKLQPIFAISLAAILLKEKIGKQFVLWASLAIVAGYFLTFGFHSPILNVGDNTALAAAFSLLAAFSFGSSTVLSKKMLGKFDFSSATFFRYGFTTLIMLFIVIFANKLNFQNVTSTHWILFIIIGLTTGSGAIFLYYFGLTRVKAIVATICELCFPISAILFDYFINNKTLSSVQWVAAAIMIFAIVMLNIRKAKQS